jgi:hypothetical protein
MYYSYACLRTYSYKYALRSCYTNKVRFKNQRISLRRLRNKHKIAAVRRRAANTAYANRSLSAYTSRVGYQRYSAHGKAVAKQRFQLSRLYPLKKNKRNSSRAWRNSTGSKVNIPRFLRIKKRLRMGRSTKHAKRYLNMASLTRTT